ncbi:MAG: hypothetical protein RL208_379 [Pseudomonadota bacterium]|jgi:chorismate synthase
MAGNVFGNLFKITTFGESHGVAVGCVIDGCPPLVELCEEDIQKELDKRKTGQSKITTQRADEDRVQILSGIFEGKTTGTPICLIVYNKDQKSQDYDKIKDIFRPGHADFVYQEKYGIRDHRGGGRSSARETVARVAAGAIAKKFLKEKLNIDIMGFTSQIGSIKAEVDIQTLNREAVEKQITKCPDEQMSSKMIELIEQKKAEGDSVGGVVRCVIKNCPVGLGEPAFDKLPALLAHAMMSINAAKAFEIGEGFNCVEFFGSQHNDEFFIENETVKTKTNHSGGVLGGISNGADIDFSVYFKAVSTIKKRQNTVNKNLESVQIEITEGRHDPCVVPRAVPIVESMAALVLMDLFLINRGIYERD